MTTCGLRRSGHDSGSPRRYPAMMDGADIGRLLFVPRIAPGIDFRTVRRAQTSSGMTSFCSILRWD
jgi:hypothetical protein